MNPKAPRTIAKKTITEEEKIILKKIGDKLRGRKQTDEEKLTRSLANMGKKREKKLCPHCDRLVAVNGYARWHGANCAQAQSQPIST